jgi:hypothetical protein
MKKESKVIFIFKLANLYKISNNAFERYKNKILMLQILKDNNKLLII